MCLVIGMYCSHIAVALIVEGEITWSDECVLI